MTGNIPVELENLQSLEYLTLSYNFLIGRIPAGLGNLQNLEFLGISSNDLTGRIPKELANLQNLESLYLDDNDLSGCYDPVFANTLCNLMFSNISARNNFDADWEDFCLSGAGACEVNCAVSNIALSGAPSASSYFNTPNASNLNDDVISNNTSDLVHTGFSSISEWVQIDLGQSQSISSILIWNRTDCCQSRLSEAYVMIADSAFPSNTDLNAALNNADYYVQLGDMSNLDQVSVDIQSVGQYVRIQKSVNGLNTINIKELQIFGLSQAQDANTNFLCDYLEICPENYSGINQLSNIQQTNQHFETDGDIESNQILGNAANPIIRVDYDSKSSILLMQNFETPLGVTFNAYIDGCN